MLRYSIKRILLIIPVLICVTFIIYALLDLAPGSVVDMMISDEMTQEDVAVLMAKYDMDKPMIYRYGKFIFGLLQGDLGVSMLSGESVWQVYVSRWPATLKLSLSSLVLGVVLGISLGIFAAKHAGTILDNLTTAFTLIGLSMPGFWLGLLLLMWFSYNVRLFPTAYDGTWRSYVLPVIATGFSLSATITRQTRSAILEVVRQDFLRTARAKGVPEWQVTIKHVLRNAWIPIVTQIGMMLGITLAGSAVIETVYSWPGVGNLMVTAISRRDITMACGCVSLTCILYVLLLFIVDLSYAFIDPKIRAMYSSGRRKKRRVET